MRGRRLSDEEAFWVQSRAGSAFFTVRLNCKVAEVLHICIRLMIHSEFLEMEDVWCCFFQAGLSDW